MPCNEGNLWIFLTMCEAVCGSPLARTSSQGGWNVQFSEMLSWSVQDLVKPHVGWPQRPSRVPYWFESSSFKITWKLWPLKPNYLWSLLCCKDSGTAGFAEMSSFASVNTSSPITAQLSFMGWWHVITVGPGAGVWSHFPLKLQSRGILT